MVATSILMCIENFRPIRNEEDKKSIEAIEGLFSCASMMGVSIGALDSDIILPQSAYRSMVKNAGLFSINVENLLHNSNWTRMHSIS